MWVRDSDVAEKSGKHTECPIIINTQNEHSLRTKYWREKVSWKLGVLFSAIGSIAQTWRRRRRPNRSQRNYMRIKGVNLYAEQKSVVFVWSVSVEFAQHTKSFNMTDMLPQCWQRTTQEVFRLAALLRQRCAGNSWLHQVSCNGCHAPFLLYTHDTVMFHVQKHELCSLFHRPRYVFLCTASNCTKQNFGFHLRFVFSQPSSYCLCAVNFHFGWRIM